MKKAAAITCLFLDILAVADPVKATTAEAILNFTSSV